MSYCGYSGISRGMNLFYLLLQTRVVFVSYFLVFANFDVCSGQQKFAIEPQNQTAIVGSRVTLPCRFAVRLGTVVQWTLNDFGLGVQRNLPSFKRYSMIGSDEEGDYTLHISPVQIEDDGKYQCQVGFGPNGEEPQRSAFAYLNVIKSPDPPEILQGDFYSTTEDRNITLECISNDGKPAATITWVASKSGVLTQGVTSIEERIRDEKTFLSRSIINIPPKPEYNNQTITCEAQNLADPVPRTTSIRIEVKYAPKVKLVIKSRLKQVPEGSNINIECEAKGNPSNMTFKWYENGLLIVDNYSSELKIYNITRLYNKIAIKCEVSNDIGKSEESRTLEVTYPPTFRSHPNDVEVDIGNVVTLRCDVDSYPAPKIRWLHQKEDENIFVGKAANLTLHVKTTHIAGNYICIATVPGYPEIETSASIFIKGPPKIISEDKQFGSQGLSVQIECAAYSVPRFESIVWTFEGKELDYLNDQDYAFSEDLQAGGFVNSTLMIRESLSKHFGTYVCTVSNEYGTDSIEIIVTSNETFPHLLTLFGVTAVLIVVTAILILVIFCRKKQRDDKGIEVTYKPDVTVTAEELFTANNRNSNTSDLKFEMRQANGSCEEDYPNIGSDSTISSKAKLGSRIPLEATVPLNSITHSNTYKPYGDSNDYSDPAYADCYKVNYVHYEHEYTPGSLRIESSTLSSDKQMLNMSVNSSLLRSEDTASRVQFNPGNGSQNNSLQRKRKYSSSALNNLGLPYTEAVSRVPKRSVHQSVDVHYAATYGNPHLRSGGGLGFTANTANPARTPAPPPYPSVRRSVVLPSGTSSHSITSPTSSASLQCATCSTTTSTTSTDSTQPAIGVATSSAASQSPSAHYILAPSNRIISNAIVTKKGNGLQATNV